MDYFRLDAALGIGAFAVVAFGERRKSAAERETGQG